MIFRWLKRRREKRDHLILILLQQHGEAGGLDLVKSSNRRLKRGTIYIHIARLEDAKLVQRRIVPYVSEVVSVDHLPRHLFSLTKQGRRGLIELEDKGNIYR